MQIKGSKYTIFVTHQDTTSGDLSQFFGEIRDDFPVVSS
jgi:hypothetical protein